MKHNFGKNYSNKESAKVYTSLVKDKDWKDNFKFVNENHKGANGCNYMVKHGFSSLIYTDGCQDVFSSTQSYWLLDLMVSLGNDFYQENEFAVWNLIFYNDNHFVICSDGNYNVLVSMKIPFSDFNSFGYEGAEFWVSNGTIMLPEEY